MRRAVAGVAMLGLLAVGCSTRSGAHARAAGTGGGDRTAPATGASVTHAPGGATSAPGDAAAPTPGASVPGVAPRTASPTPMPTPTIPRDVPVTASVSPACVRPGGTMTMTLSTQRKAAVGFQAVYADGVGGAPSPWGRGYGGNDKGYADESGRYVTTWVVAPNAPPGSGHVDVVIGWQGKYGYADPAFAVAGGDGAC